MPASTFLSAAEIGLALLESRTVPEPDEADLLALALGVADRAQREACACALLSGERTARRLQDAMAHPMADKALGLPPEDRRRWAVEAFLGEAERAARLLAEGLQEGETILATSLVGLRVGWRLASETSDQDAVARFAEALMAELMERGAWEELAELAEIGYRAADALDRPRLRSRLLAYEGAAWSRRGDYERAARLWTERVALNRRIGNSVGEADALMDLAGDALERGDLVAWEGWTAQAEDAVGRSGRSVLAARLWTQRAHERLRALDIEGAAHLADRAMEELSDALQIDNGLGVRLIAARVLAKCGQERRALIELAGLLTLALSEGRPALAALLLEAIGDILVGGNRRLSCGCLRCALLIHRSLGTRRAGVLALRIGESCDEVGDRAEPGWKTLAHGLLIEIEDLCLEISLT